MGQPYQGQPGEEIDPERVDIYRGGHDLAPKPDEYKLDPVSGFVKNTHGVSQTIVDVGNAKLIFEGGFDDLDAYNALGAGYRGAVVVELAGSSRHPVVFYDTVRLQQDLAEETKLGTPFIAEHGMIVLTEVSLDNMKSAVNRLQRTGYFAANGKRQ